MEKIGDVLKKAAVFVVAIATLGTAYHTGHTDSDIHKLMIQLQVLMKH